MNPKGAVLIITIWTLSILVVLVLGIGFRMTLEARIADYNIKEFKLLQIAKSAAVKFKAVSDIDESKSCDSLGEDWSNNDELFENVALGDGIFTIGYLRKDGNEETFFYGAEDEESKININIAPREILLNLPDITEEIADSILDWADEDEIPHVNGSESDYYLSLEYPYSCKNSSLQSKEELLLVNGVTVEIYEGIKDLITVHGEGKVNLNTATSRVMEVLGLDSVSIEKYRKGNDGEEGTADDRVFTSMDDVKTDDVGLTIHGKTKIDELNSIMTRGPQAGIIGVGTRNFRVCITAKTRDGKVIKKVEAVITRSDENNKLAETWHEY